MVRASGGQVASPINIGSKETDCCAAYKFPKAQERLEELKKGGPRLQKDKENREKPSRKDAKESDCVVM